MLLGNVDNYHHKASIISMPRCDAFLHVVSKLVTKLNKPSKLFLDKDMHCRKISNHIKNLRLYSELKIGFAMSNTKPKSKKTVSKQFKDASWKNSKFTNGKQYVTGSNYATVGRAVDGDRVLGNSGSKVIGSNIDFNFMNPNTQQNNFQPVQPTNNTNRFAKFDPSKRY